MKIRLYLNKTLYENLQEYYELAKSLKNKIKHLEEIIKKYEQEIEKLKFESEENKDILFKFLSLENKKWYKKFGWSFTSSGKLVIFGKNASMNEVLIKKYLSENDIVFHADIIGAAFVIVKSEKLDEQEINEVAKISACFSKAWKNCIYSVDVYYVKGYQISKTPPSGMYLKKGAFMIYGERNYVKNVPLEICLGLNFKEYSFIVGDEKVCQKYSKIYWKIIPSTSEKDFERLINEIKKVLPLSKENIKKFLIKYLPSKNIRIVKKGEGSEESFPSDDWVTRR